MTNNKEYTRAYRRKNGRDYASERAARKRHYLKNRVMLDAAKNKPCADCGGTFPPECMDFHHIGEKNFGIATAISGGQPRLIAEIAKCIVICANCHRIRTRKEKSRG